MRTKSKYIFRDTKQEQDNAEVANKAETLNVMFFKTL